MTITLIDEARYDAEMDATVLPALQACMTEGWMEPATVDWEGKALPKLERPGRLHYYRYDARTFDALREEGASGVFRGTIVISHGFTEFGRKYSEMVWYFLLAGYSVCVFEHRGHGHSAHDMSNPSLVWIDDWRRYVADFATFAQTVGREAADGGPMYLYCHSMGGGIGAAALERYPSLFDKAVLSAPMIAPVVGMRVGRTHCGRRNLRAWLRQIACVRAYRFRRQPQSRRLPRGLGGTHPLVPQATFGGRDVPDQRGHVRLGKPGDGAFPSRAQT